MTELLKTEADITSRKEFRGHVTCSGIVINKQNKLLMIYHRTLEKWLFPGGHIETEDKNLRSAAKREIIEETGITAELLQNFDDWFDKVPIHIDCHSIPANPAKNEPEHKHIDCRFVFKGDTENVALQLEEVTDWARVEASKAPIQIHKRLQTFALI